MKTIEEEALEYAERTDKANAEFVAEDFKAGVTFAQRWANVKYELPDINISVITRNNDYIRGGYRICRAVNCYADNGEFSHKEFLEITTGEIIRDVAFWRPVELI
jgi:hypothetical protein